MIWISLPHDVHKTLMDNEIEKWYSEMERQPKMRLYKQLKCEYKPECYVKSNISKSSRSFVAQLRTGTLPLMVEIGRFQQKDVKERTCPYCKGNTVEDEVHFIFYCPLYADLRNDFTDSLKDKFDIRDDMNDIEKLKLCMESTNFGAFIKDCYFKRSDYIFKVT